jgi:hypothetical protein
VTLATGDTKTVVEQHESKMPPSPSVGERDTSRVDAQDAVGKPLGKEHEKEARP